MHGSRLEAEYPEMPKANTDHPRRVPPIVTTVVQSIARRLARMESLLIEMQHEQSVHLKRVTSLQVQLDELTERVGANGTSQQSGPRRRQGRPEVRKL